jgi:pimeloyl-ACP methyl ester carboxylesterase
MDTKVFQTEPLYVEQWGSGGSTAVLVHGGGNGGAANFQQQKLLADRWVLLLPDRQGHGKTPMPADGVRDFEKDAPLIADLLGDGAHLLGHSYGGVVALLAAALRPDAVLSLTLVEPAAFQVAAGNAEVDAFAATVRDLWANPPEPEVFLRRFFEVNGIPAPLPSSMPPPMLAAAKAMLNIRGPWEAVIPVERLRAASFPKLIISGGHKDGFEAIADTLSDKIGAERLVLRGMGHSVQEVGEPFNAAVAAFWSKAEQQRYG